MTCGPASVGLGGPAMNGKNFTSVVGTIVQNDPRYGREAYNFIRGALDFTLKGPGSEPRGGKGKHVSGSELLMGIRDYALDQYGPMTMIVLEHWGIRECSDFGEIVFNLVDHGVFGKTANDHRKDFKGGYDFHDTFAKPFLPQHGRKLKER